VFRQSQWDHDIDRRLSTANLAFSANTAGYFYNKYERKDYETAGRLGSPAKAADLFDAVQLEQNLKRIALFAKNTF
jgi:hypothetical protein